MVQWQENLECPGLKIVCDLVIRELEAEILANQFVEVTQICTQGHHDTDLEPLIEDASSDVRAAGLN